ncbi:FecR family protein [Synechococcus sp. CS-1328]|uniref:FecR family protein n=1 Tax=Synechococcus sp. CS-1328 TaxID=2847976 RepID=UPI00223B9943|nr:FecR family protein [Synechococcus sp. CS-1328]
MSSGPPAWSRRGALLWGTTALIGLAATLSLGPAREAGAAASLPKVVDVPSRPAFVRPPGRNEQRAQSGQVLPGRSVLRTQNPGRMQVQLANGRSFRLGGDAVLRLAAAGLDLERGQIIAWVNPGSKGGAPLRVKTRVGTASIEGTTVFLEVTDDSIKVFSWEGQVRVTPEVPVAGAPRDVVLRSGEELTYSKGAWQAPRRLDAAEAGERRRKSILLNGFTAPMATLPVIERELGLKPGP